MRARPGALELCAMLALAGFAPAQITLRVTASPTGEQGASQSGFPALSSDGRFVAFDSNAHNFVPDDENHAGDCFFLDRQTGAVVRTSVGPLGVEASAASGGVSISGDGAVTCFHSFATNLVPGDTNGHPDVFVHVLATGTTERVSLPALGGEADGPSFAGHLSGDGRHVLFMSQATNLVPGDANGMNDVFVRDRATGITELASRGAGGAPANGQSYPGDISGDGRYVLFETLATNIVGTSQTPSVVVHDRVLGTSEPISVAAGGSVALHGASSRLSDDGRYAVFHSAAALVPGDVNGRFDVYVRDRVLGTTTLASVATNGTPADGDCAWPDISGDGQIVAFISWATNLGGGSSPHPQVYVHEGPTGVTTRVSVSSTGQTSNGECYDPRLSGDGRLVGFRSKGPNLVSGDTNAQMDGFLRDRASPCPPFVFYCTAKTSSSGCAPQIAAGGAPSFSGHDAFFVTAVGEHVHAGGGHTGLFFWGHAPTGTPFAGGWLCVQAPVKRTPPQVKTMGQPCNGFYTFHFSQAYMAQAGLGPGSTVYGQYWNRDSGFPPPDNVGMTNAISFTICL